MVSLGPWLALLPASMPLLDLTALLPQVSELGVLLVLQAGGCGSDCPHSPRSWCEAGKWAHSQLCAAAILSCPFQVSVWHVWANPEAETFSILISLEPRNFSGPC